MADSSLPTRAASTNRFTSRWTRSIGRILPGIYDDLRELAARFMSRERGGHTLQPTALVHEAFIRLSESPELDVSDPTHARALAAQTMRRVLVDHARRSAMKKRAGKADEIPLDESLTSDRAGTDAFSSLVQLDDAILALQRIDPRRARVVELRFFAGLSLEETAQQLGISERTVTYDTRAACTWLRAEIAKTTS